MQGFSPGPGCGRADPCHTRERGTSPASSLASTLASSALGGSYMEMRRVERSAGRKRQNSEGDSLVWERLRGCESESEMVSSTSSLRLHQRRGSEGSDVAEVKKGVFMQLLEKVRLRDEKKKSDYESDADEGRASSRERGGSGGRVVTRVPRPPKHPQDHHVDRYMDLAAAAFDASALPERPKSACDNTLLRTAARIYSGLGSTRGLSGDADPPSRTSADRLDEARMVAAACYARDSSAGRARSAERDGGMRGTKTMLVPQGAGRSGELNVSEVKAIVHAEQPGGPRKLGRKDLETIYAVATVPRKATSKKENIYENVPVVTEAGPHMMHQVRPLFKKQNSLDAIPSDGGRGSMGRRSEGGSSGGGGGTARHGTLRKADSFEGHEEAVKTLVAAVHETRILRRKKTK
ncbi:hypothetical protein Pcinc_024065 [Petrolisthes cinctipes]|uniref:Uncharacterized protein n=1 Tax=Petrolisthes cinctipes TaxID=88211 RepID=A0AAE1KDJ2_PETCI|nr:hypothetical protein Pcinc_024065 [Petrolisthes cinctipes]